MVQVMHGEHVVRHDRDGRHLLHREPHELLPKLDAARIVEVDRADLLDDLVQLGVRPALPVARRLPLAGLGDELRVPTVEEERQVGVASPGLDRPADLGLEIAVEHLVPNLWIHSAGRIDAGLDPLLHDDRSETRQHAFGDMAQLDGKPLAVRHVPRVAALFESRVLQQQCRRLQVLAPPAVAERTPNRFLVLRYAVELAADARLTARTFLRSRRLDRWRTTRPVAVRPPPSAWRESLPARRTLPGCGHRAGVGRPAGRIRPHRRSRTRRFGGTRSRCRG